MVKRFQSQCVLHVEREVHSANELSLSQLSRHDVAPVCNRSLGSQLTLTNVGVGHELR